MAPEESRSPEQIARQIVEQTNALARQFYAIMSSHVPKGYRFERSTHPKEVQVWRMACAAQSFLTDTDVEILVAALERIEADEDNGGVHG
jgi:hypothetical protein